jgi:hypothetical protein
MTTVDIEIEFDFDFFNTVAHFKDVWTWRPRRCYISRKLIWGKAVMGVAMYTGPGAPVIEYRWYHRPTFVFKRLQGEI